MDRLWGVSDCQKGKVWIFTGSFACSQYSLDLVGCGFCFSAGLMVIRAGSDVIKLELFRKILEFNVVANKSIGMPHLIKCTFNFFITAWDVKTFSWSTSKKLE